MNFRSLDWAISSWFLYIFFQIDLRFCPGFSLWLVNLSLLKCCSLFVARSALPPLLLVVLVVWIYVLILSQVVSGSPQSCHWNPLPVRKMMIYLFLWLFLGLYPHGVKSNNELQPSSAVRIHMICCSHAGLRAQPRNLQPEPCYSYRSAFHFSSVF